MSIEVDFVDTRHRNRTVDAVCAFYSCACAMTRRSTREDRYGREIEERRLWPWRKDDNDHRFKQLGRQAGLPMA